MLSKIFDLAYISWYRESKFLGEVRGESLGGKWILIHLIICI